MNEVKLDKLIDPFGPTVAVRCDFLLLDFLRFLYAASHK